MARLAATNYRKREVERAGRESGKKERKFSAPRCSTSKIEVREERRAGKSHVIKQRGMKNNFEHCGNEGRRKGMAPGHTHVMGKETGKCSECTRTPTTHLNNN